jgi:hypothetical protein
MIGLFAGMCAHTFCFGQPSVSAHTPPSSHQHNMHTRPHQHPSLRGHSPGPRTTHPASLFVAAGARWSPLCVCGTRGKEKFSGCDPPYPCDRAGVSPHWLYVCPPHHGWMEEGKDPTGGTWLVRDPTHTHTIIRSRGVCPPPLLRGSPEASLAVRAVATHTPPPPHNTGPGGMRGKGPGTHSHGRYHNVVARQVRGRL